MAAYWTPLMVVVGRELTARPWVQAPATSSRGAGVPLVLYPSSVLWPSKRRKGSSDAPDGSASPVLKRAPLMTAEAPGEERSSMAAGAAAAARDTRLAVSRMFFNIDPPFSAMAIYLERPIGGAEVPGE